MAWTPAVPRCLVNLVSTGSRHVSVIHIGKIPAPEPGWVPTDAHGRADEDTPGQFLSDLGFQLCRLGSPSTAPPVRAAITD